jgi:glycerate kinase
MVTSYGEISGFTAVNADDLMLVNGGKGSSSNSSSSSSSYSTAIQYSHPANQVILEEVYKSAQTSGTAFVEAAKAVAAGSVTVVIGIFSPPLASLVYSLLNPGSGSHTTAH